MEGHSLFSTFLCSTRGNMGNTKEKLETIRLTTIPTVYSPFLNTRSHLLQSAVLSLPCITAHNQSLPLSFPPKEKHTHTMGSSHSKPRHRAKANQARRPAPPRKHKNLAKRKHEISYPKPQNSRPLNHYQRPHPNNVRYAERPLPVKPAHVRQPRPGAPMRPLRPSVSGLPPGPPAPPRKPHERASKEETARYMKRPLPVPPVWGRMPAPPLGYDAY